MKHIYIWFILVCLITIVLLYKYKHIIFNEKSLSDKLYTLLIPLFYNKVYLDSKSLTFLDVNMPGDSYNASIIAVNSQQMYSYTINDNTYNILIAFRNDYKGNHNVYVTSLVDASQPFIKLCDSCEDPRFVTFKNKLYIAASKKTSSFPNIMKQYVYDLENNYVYIPKLNNVKSEDNWEKNWQFVECKASPYVIYSINPFIVYRLNPSTLEVESLIKSYTWSCPNLPSKIRCSTVPIWINDKFYMLIHDIKYRIYVITFSETFDVLQYNPKPICEEFGCKYGIYFACGCIYNSMSNQFIISMGINDKKIAILKVSKSTIDKNLEDVHST